MRRREFVLGVGSAAAWPLAVRAQPSERVRRIGVLMTTAERDREQKDYVRAFLQELRALGWEQGRNVKVEFRWGESNADHIKADAAELASRNPDVIFAQSTPAVAALREATRTIPIIFIAVSDPAFVENLARPNGNATGFTNFESSMGGKWLEVLKEMAPRMVGATAIYNPTTSPHIAAGRYLLSLEDTAGRLSIRMTISPVHSSTDIEQAIARIADVRYGGLVLLPDAFITDHADLIISRTAKYRLPAIYAFDFMAWRGGLVSYGINPAEQYLGAAAYVDRILRGAAIADLPVQAPTRFRLVVNHKTAKALGLEVPPTLQARADEVIE